jgi:hypothetical protein
VDDQHLREQRLDEPAGLEKSRPLGNGRVKNEEHDQIRRVVEDRAARSRAAASIKGSDAL